MFAYVLDGIFPSLSYPRTMAELKEEIIISAATVCAIIVERRRRRRKQQKPRLWCRSWIEKRSKYGAYNCLLKELKLSDKPRYKNFLRMTEAAFEELLQKVVPLIQKQDTLLRTSIPPGERLAITLRYLASGKFPHPASPLKNKTTNFPDCRLLN